MLSSIKKLLRKYFKSKPKRHVGHNIPQDDTPGLVADKPVWRPEDEAIYEGAASTRPTNNPAPPPPYSQPLNSNHRISPRFTTCTQEPSAVSRVEIRKVDYCHPNEDRRQSRAQDFQQTSPPYNQRPRASNHETPGQGRASERAFGPGSEFDKAFGPGGTMDAVFGPGGTFDTVFGPGGTFERQVREGNAPQSTNFAHTNVYTHFSSASPNGESSSYLNPDMDFAVGDTEYWTGNYEHPTRNMGMDDPLREKGGHTSSARVSKFHYRPEAQSDDRRRPTYQDANRQESPFASGSFFQNCNNLTINACNITHIVNTSHDTTIRTTATSSGASPQFRSGVRRAQECVAYLPSAYLDAPSHQEHI